MLLGTSLFWNLLREKGAIAKRQGQGIVRARNGAKGAGYGFLKNSDPTISFNQFWISEILWKWSKI